MRGSCPESAPELDLSCCLESGAQIERAHGADSGVREIAEAPVAADPLFTRGSLVRLLDRPGAARKRLAGELERPVAPAALGRGEELDVDLGREDRVRAAHVAGLG